MELQWIDDFLALCETRNFTRAAQARCTTQSAYSRRMQRLEDWLGAPLFDRERRPVALTPAGEEFLARAHRLRDDIFDARRAVLAVSSHLERSLRIYTTNTLAATVLSPWLIERGLRNYSLIVASVSGCLEAVRRGHADLALTPHFGDAEALAGLATRPIGEDRLILAQSRATKSAVTLSDGQLAGALMLYTPGTQYGARIAGMLDANRIYMRDRPVCESASAEALLAQVKAGLGAAWIPAILLGDETTSRCRVPDFFDVPYTILLVEPLAGRDEAGAAVETVDRSSDRRRPL
ncbi:MULTISPECIES: LysR family transcriptional regulator [Methylosinus]|uniref:LysR family transcriptional regulator n=1 Tax=Methylosinus trichosporium (strain ATCC 35070 / NCIMB 11131 / UNIQEM 75 / OB3b) TaxID=595536 RepID=A0A2D2D566_METT3|nr:MULTISPECIES: LysR family transcriptional regulator [Methylosinus]ATQ70112.1 LysR family transcriptional regulator [Methylosinus trichosporium OB3b]